MINFVLTSGKIKLQLAPSFVTFYSFKFSKTLFFNSSFKRQKQRVYRVEKILLNFIRRRATIQTWYHNVVPKETLRIY